MNLDRMLYLVISSLKKSGVGPLILEVEVSRMDRDQVARDVRNGQYEDVLHVLEINPIEGICRDVTDEFSNQTAP